MTVTTQIWTQPTGSHTLNNNIQWLLYISNGKGHLSDHNLFKSKAGFHFADNRLRGQSDQGLVWAKLYFRSSKKSNLLLSVSLTKGYLSYKMKIMRKKRKTFRKYYKIINIIMEGKNSHRLILTEKAFCWPQKKPEKESTIFLALKSPREDRKEGNASCLTFRRWRKVVKSWQQLKIHELWGH